MIGSGFGKEEIPLYELNQGCNVKRGMEQKARARKPFPVSTYTYYFLVIEAAFSPINNLIFQQKKF
jgi:hypothetical protein